MRLWGFLALLVSCVLSMAAARPGPNLFNKQADYAKFSQTLQVMVEQGVVW